MEKSVYYLTRFERTRNTIFLKNLESLRFRRNKYNKAPLIELPEKLNRYKNKPSKCWYSICSHVWHLKHWVPNFFKIFASSNELLGKKAKRLIIVLHNTPSSQNPCTLLFTNLSYLIFHITIYNIIFNITFFLFTQTILKPKPTSV